MAGVRQQERPPGRDGSGRGGRACQIAFDVRPQRPRAALVEESGDRGEADGFGQNTITATSADLAPQTARTVVEPGPTPTTLPLEQVATEGSDDVHVTATSGIG